MMEEIPNRSEPNSILTKICFARDYRFREKECFFQRRNLCNKIIVSCDIQSGTCDNIESVTCDIVCLSGDNLF